MAKSKYDLEAAPEPLQEVGTRVVHYTPKPPRDKWTAFIEPTVRNEWLIYVANRKARKEGTGPELLEAALKAYMAAHPL